MPHNHTLLPTFAVKLAARLPGGRFHKRHLTDAVRRNLELDNLDPHVKAVALTKLAESLVTVFGDRRNPRRRGTGTLFHPQDT